MDKTNSTYSAPLENFLISLNMVKHLSPATIHARVMVPPLNLLLSNAITTWTDLTLLLLIILTKSSRTNAKVRLTAHSL
jgi:hypothetical protein